MMGIRRTRNFTTFLLIAVSTVMLLCAINFFKKYSLAPDEHKISSHKFPHHNLLGSKSVRPDSADSQLHEDGLHLDIEPKSHEYKEEMSVDGQKEGAIEEKPIDSVLDENNEGKVDDDKAYENDNNVDSAKNDKFNNNNLAVPPLALNHEKLAHDATTAFEKKDKADIVEDYAKDAYVEDNGNSQVDFPNNQNIDQQVLEEFDRQAENVNERPTAVVYEKVDSPMDAEDNDNRVQNLEVQNPAPNLDNTRSEPRVRLNEVIDDEKLPLENLYNADRNLKSQKISGEPEQKAMQKGGAGSENGAPSDDILIPKESIMVEPNQITPDPPAPNEDDGDDEPGRQPAPGAIETALNDRYNNITENGDSDRSEKLGDNDILAMKPPISIPDLREAPKDPIWERNHGVISENLDGKLGENFIENNSFNEEPVVVADEQQQPAPSKNEQLQHNNELPNQIADNENDKMISLDQQLQLNVSNNPQTETKDVQLPSGKVLNNADIPFNVSEPFLLMPPVPRGRFLGKTLIDPVAYEPLKIVYCGITKTAHSQFRALFCHALLKDNREEFLKNPYMAHDSKHCKSLEKYLWQFNEDEKQEIYTSRDWVRLATVRNPIERFISGYVDKCEREKENCYSCEIGDIRCFAEQTLEFMQKLSTGQIQYDRFDHYINHFYPQFWNCDFQGHLADYSLFFYNETESFRQDVRDRMLDYGVPESSILTGWGVDRSRPFMEVSTEHVTNKDVANELYHAIVTDLDVLDILFRLYYIDYYYFPFQLPREASQLCQAAPNHGERYAICSFL